jgi:hypothetical protein
MARRPQHDPHEPTPVAPPRPGGSGLPETRHGPVNPARHSSPHPPPLQLPPPPKGSAAELKASMRSAIPFASNTEKNYHQGIMDNAAKACQPAADYFGLPVEVVTETLAELREKAARAATRRAKAKPRLKKANPELTAVRLKAAYEVLVRESDLANPKLSDEERMSRAIHLRNTYDRLHKLDPSFEDRSEQLKLARKLLNARAYQRRKAAKLAA